MKKKWLLLIVVAAAGFFLDWLTKHLAQTHLSYGVPVRIAGDFFQLLLVYNKGALFGFNPQSIFASFPVNHFFIVFTVLAVVVLILYYRTIPRTEIALHWGVIMILPGALGNFLDRIIHPHKGVVDFIRIGISDELYWPIFNFADIYVTTGLILMVFAFLTEDKRKKHQAVSVNSTNTINKESSAAAGSNVSGNDK